MAKEGKPATGDNDNKGAPATGDDTGAAGDQLGDAGKRALQAERERARKAEADLKAARDELDKLKADSDASKSEMDKVQEQITKLEQRAEKAERQALVSTVAQEKGLTAGQARRLAGSTREELEADADEMIAEFGIDKAKSNDNGAKARPQVRPEPSAGDKDDTTDYAKVADSILR